MSGVSTAASVGAAAAQMPREAAAAATQASTAASEAAIQAPGAAQQLVLADLGAVVLALPVDAVVQALAWPARLDVLPRRSGAALGVFDYLGQSVAMLDLALWVAVGAQPASPRRYPRALVLRDGARMVAIAVDAVRGLHSVPAGALTQISHDGDSTEVFDRVARCENVAAVVNVINVGRLMALAQTWSDGGLLASAAASVKTARAPTASYAVVAGAACEIAFPVADLIEVLPALPLRDFQSVQTEGLCEWRGRHLPVTSLAKCFPTLAVAGARMPPMLSVFERDGAALGVLLDQVPQIRQLATAGDDALTVIADASGTLVHQVGMAALFSRFPETALSRSAGVQRARQSDHEASNSGSHIVFEADGVASTPIEGIEAVLPMPALAPGATHMAWRGAALALHDLRAHAGERGTVIVVKGQQAPRGFLVDAVVALVQPRAGRMSRLAIAGRGSVDLLTTGSGAQQKTYLMRDLAALAG